MHPDTRAARGFASCDEGPTGLISEHRDQQPIVDAESDFRRDLCRGRFKRMKLGDTTKSVLIVAVSILVLGLLAALSTGRPKAKASRGIIQHNIVTVPITGR
jgi:hypothetical protein